MDQPQVPARPCKPKRIHLALAQDKNELCAEAVWRPHPKTEYVHTRPGRHIASIVRQADHDRLPHKLHLFYSNRRPEDAPFLDVLQMLEKTNPNSQLVCTMTEMSRSRKEWKGETGLINQEMLSRHLTNLQGPIYYIAGPPAMVAGMRTMLVAANVDEDDVRTEDFAGY